MMHAGESRIPSQRGKGVGCWLQAEFVYTDLTDGDTRAVANAALAPVSSSVWTDVRSEH